MIEKVNKLEKGLRDQLSSLADEIRKSENNLLATKEGYLKVQGALEILDILKRDIELEDPATEMDIALS